MKNRRTWIVGVLIGAGALGLYLGIVIKSPSAASLAYPHTQAVETPDDARLAQGGASKPNEPPKRQPDRACVASTNSEAAKEGKGSEAPDSVKAYLRDLARTYDTRALPVRIRLQDQLNRYWDANPPAISELIGLAGDRTLPPDLRIYLVHTLANRVKLRAYSEEEFDTALAGLRNMVTSDEEDSGFRSDLANVLTTIDDSEAAVEAVASLLSSTNSQTVAKSVVALTHTTNPLAIETVYTFAQDAERLLAENPNALFAALGPLATTDKDMTPALNHILQNAEDFKLYAGAVQCLIQARPTVAVLESIGNAYAAKQRFTQHAEQIQYLCRAALLKHSKFYEANKDTLSDRTKNALDSLTNVEGNQ